MKTIKIYDPPMCCSTGVCGTEINPDLVSFAAMLSKLLEQGVKVERYNMSQQPMAFAQNSMVKDLLDQEGIDVLPAIFIDDKIYLTGRYPTGIERPAFSRAALAVDEK